MLRKGKTDFLVEKAQELGAHEFHPIVSEHCEVQIAKEKTGKIVERWNRIAREASKQSGSLRILQIEAPRSFKETIGDLSFDEPVVIFIRVRIPSLLRSGLWRSKDSKPRSRR